MPLPNDSLFFGFAPKLTEEQRVFVDSIFDYRITFCDAKSGTGKTMLSVACARLIEKPLYYIFAPCQEDKIGFLPGDLERKTKEYWQPLIDALIEIGEQPDRVIYSEDNIDNVKNETTWVYPNPHIYARGINIKNSTVIIDEAQNFTRGELKKVLTRIHDSCTVIVIGHHEQCDLINPQKSGFIPYLKHFQTEEYCNVCTLSHNFRGVIATHADELKW